MTLASDKLHLEYLGVALFMLGVAYALIKWVGRTIRDQLGPGMNRGEMPFLPSQADALPPGLVRQALARGLVTAEQLATMTPVERQFMFASLKDTLGEAPAPPSPAAPAPRVISGAEFGVAALPANDRLRVFCPACGEALAFPAFAPFVARCARCGTKTTLREGDAGRYVLHVAPPVADATEGPAPP